MIDDARHDGGAYTALVLRLGRATLAKQAAGLTSPMTKKGALCELADTVMMLHELGVVWGDLKPENFIQCDISGIPSRLALDFGDSALLPHVEASEAADAAIPRVFGVDDALTPPYACLLYTSPSPRDQRGSRMPSSA